MSSPRKRNSNLIADLRADRNPDDSDRIRTNMIIAARIATALHEKGWNKIKLATELKKSPSLVTRWLSGNHNFTVDTLRAIQHVLGIHLLNLQTHPTKARPCAIIPQGAAINISESEVAYTTLPAEPEGGFQPLLIQPGVRIFSARTIGPN